MSAVFESGRVAQRISLSLGGLALVAAIGLTMANPVSAEATEIEPYALSQCKSGQFCMWSSTSYSGSLVVKTGSNVSHKLTNQVKSFWNNRTTAIRLYSNSGGSPVCYPAGAKVSSVNVNYQSPGLVYLAQGGC